MGDVDRSAIHTLNQIGEALLATGTSWHVRRLSAAAGERFGADRGTLKLHIDDLVGEAVRVAVLVVVGTIGDGPALVTSAQLRAYPEDATLPLAWIGERLRKVNAEQLLVVVSGRAENGGGAARAWLDALATNRRDHVIAVDASDSGAPLVDAVLTGMCGDALDPSTGTVTMKSIGEYLGKRVPSAVLQASLESHTFVTPPPLGGLWDVRRSQLSMLGTVRSRASGEHDDLTGTVLPGRFRLDAIVARGTFGTVYRAHQLAVERDVAIKVLHADIDPASDDGRLFVHEVRAVGRIDHANVVRIHQADITHDGRLFYAMELLEGRDLQQLVAGGPIAKERALELAAQLLAALGAAHDAGLIHADIKPANAIVVERDGKERVVLVDFGLARLRAADRAAESAGGTPAYMAPEQMHEGRVDARSDLFSAALVIVALITGWRRPNAQTMLPPFEQIDDAELREVLRRALAIDPGDRYQAARELAAALTGTAVTPAPHVEPTLPFRQFAPLTDADRGRLHGRDADVAMLIEHVLYRRSLIYTAPSGTGKTSLLCAGLVPRLEALGIAVAYVRCRNAQASAVATSIVADATTIGDAVTRHHEQHGGKLVIILDQLETALGEGDLVAEALGFAAWPSDADVSIVLSVREDHLARLVARAQLVEPTISIVRLPPLALAGARAAIIAPLTEARLAIEPELLDVLLVDLEDAAAAIALDMGWGDTPAVYPPHLQLACSVLYEELGSGEATLTLEHYRRLGGFDAIVGEHLERVLDVELAGGSDVVARDLLVALVVSGERAMRTEAELVAIVGTRHGPERVYDVLELLRQRGLLVRVLVDAEASWELVHDSLVPRVLAWLDRRDLARRRAIELVRYHLRRSRPDAPSLLDRAELRELRPYDNAIAELDAEWRQSRKDDAWTPTRLVSRSRNVLRRRTLTYASIIGAALAISGGAVARDRVEEARRRREQSLLDRDIGRFSIDLQPIDWDPDKLVAMPVPRRELPDLRWTLHYPAQDDPDSPGTPYEARHLVHRDGDHVEAHGGRAFLVVEGRGRVGERCTPSIIPITVPGYARRVREETVRIAVPSCRATRAGMIDLAAGPFIFGGVGEPPSKIATQYADVVRERRVALPAFAIDRTEVTNAAFAQFATMATLTGIQLPRYPTADELGSPDAANHPVAGITWTEARAFCRWLGKRLPTSQEWTRALRGGERLADGSPNPHPRRNLPWGEPQATMPAKLIDAHDPGTAPVGSHPGDRSPDGIFDLAGNAIEWTDSLSADVTGMHVVRGGGAHEVANEESLLDFTAIDNPRPPTTRNFDLGVRCVYDVTSPPRP